MFSYPYHHSHNYLNALAEACAADAVLIAEEAARQEEEELLQLRLHQLRRSRFYPTIYSQGYRPCAHAFSRIGFPESLGLREEERLTRLEVLYLEREARLRSRRQCDMELTPELRTASPFEQGVCAQDALCRKTRSACKCTNTIRSSPKQTQFTQTRMHPLHRAQAEKPQEPASPTNNVAATDALNILRQLGFTIHAEGRRTEAKDDKEPVQELQQMRDRVSGLGNNSKPSGPQAAQNSTRATLKEQLEKRLNNEYVNELFDTIQAIRTSLSDHAMSGPGPSGTRATTSAAAATPTKDQFVMQSVKGKSREVPVSDETLETTSEGIKDTTKRILAIERHFHSLSNEFTLPSQLDFISVTPSDDGSAPATSRLAYTANNLPTRSYEQSLSRLLSELDSIESHGDEELRKRRKEVVDKVKRTLEELELEVEGSWNAKVAKESRMTIPVEVPQDNLAAPTPTVSGLVQDDQGMSLALNTAPFPVQLAETVPDVSFVNKGPSTNPSDNESATHNHTEAIVLIQDNPPEIQESTNDEPARPTTEVNVEGTKISPPEEESVPNLAYDEDAPSGSAILSEPPHGTLVHPTEPRETSGAQTDLSATIRPLDIDNIQFVGSPNPETGSDKSDGEGYLLENRLIEEGEYSPQHGDVEDSDSTSGDWFQVEDPVR